jgi:hypothetical protein
MRSLSSSVAISYGGGLREMGTKEDEETEESLMTLRKFIEHGANLNAQNSNGECACRHTFACT